MKRALIIITAFAILGCATPQRPTEPEVPQTPDPTEETMSKEDLATGGKTLLNLLADWLIVYPW